MGVVYMVRPGYDCGEQAWIKVLARFVEIRDDLNGVVHDVLTREFVPRSVRDAFYEVACAWHQGQEQGITIQRPGSGPWDEHAIAMVCSGDGVYRKANEIHRKRLMIMLLQWSLVRGVNINVTSG